MPKPWTARLLTLDEAHAKRRAEPKWAKPTVKAVARKAKRTDAEQLATWRDTLWNHLDEGLDRYTGLVVYRLPLDDPHPQRGECCHAYSRRDAATRYDPRAGFLASPATHRAYDAHEIQLAATTGSRTFVVDGREYFNLFFPITFAPVVPPTRARRRAQPQPGTPGTAVPDVPPSNPRLGHPLKERR